MLQTPWLDRGSIASFSMSSLFRMFTVKNNQTKEWPYSPGPGKVSPCVAMGPGKHSLLFSISGWGPLDSLNYTECSTNCWWSWQAWCALECIGRTGWRMSWGREAGIVWWGGRGPLGAAFLQLLTIISTLTWHRLQFSSLRQNKFNDFVHYSII
jgi:hypothetical protein